MRNKGFTLIELMIVIAIIAVIAAIAIPNLMSSKQAANENAALANLKSLSTSQAGFQSAVNVDQDQDGQGEYGFFEDLGANDQVDDLGDFDGTATNSKFVNFEDYKKQPSASNAWSAPDGNAMISKSGYFYQMALHITATGANSIAYTSNGTAIVDSDGINLQEMYWAAFAWPQQHGSTGKKSYAINQQGTIYITPGIADADKFTGSGDDALTLAGFMTDATDLSAQIGTGTATFNAK